MVRWLFIILFLLGFALHPARAEEPPEPPNYCHSPESWAEWDQLLAQHPDDRGLQTLHALRLGICLKVDRGELTLDEGTAIFEEARTALLAQQQTGVPVVLEQLSKDSDNCSKTTGTPIIIGLSCHVLPRWRAAHATKRPRSSLSVGRPCMKPRKKREPQQTAFLKALPPPVKNGDILDVDEAAALLKVSKKTVYARVRENAIPYAKLGRKLLFHRPSLVVRSKYSCGLTMVVFEQPTEPLSALDR